MNENEIEHLLKSTRGPDPHPDTRAAIFARVRGLQSAGVPGETVKETSPKPTQPVENSGTNRPNGMFIVAQQRKPFTRWMAVAAAALTVLVAGGALLFSPPRNEPVGVVQSEGIRLFRNSTELKPAVGTAVFSADVVHTETIADIQLNDGSRIRLDKGTKLEIQRTQEGERARLRLDAGRIFLRVAKSAKRFMVHSDGVNVEVLGTVFGVTAESRDAAVVSVYEGRVRLAASAGTLELIRGETGMAGKATAPVRTSQNPALTLAWARDWTRFEQRPLGEVLDWIEANSAYHFTAPEAIRRQVVSVAIEQEPMIRVVETLMLSCNLRYSINENDVMIKGEN